MARKFANFTGLDGDTRSVSVRDVVGVDEGEYERWVKLPEPPEEEATDAGLVDFVR